MKEGNRNNVLLIGLFAFFLWVKSCFFVAALQDNLFAFISSLGVLTIVRLLCTYASFCLLASLPLLVSKRWWSGVIGMGLLDVWLIGNLVYYRTYADLINIWVVGNVQNMTGFWASVIPFVQVLDAIFIILTILYALIAWVICRGNKTKASWTVWLGWVGSMTLLLLPWGLMNKRTDSPINPFNSYYHDVSMGRVWYCTAVGPIAYGINEAVGGCRHLCQGQSMPEGQYDLSLFMEEPTDSVVQTPNLILVLVESLESWVIGEEIEGQEITPHLNRLCKMDHTYYFPYVQDQTRQGKSSDAQLLLYAGLRPIEDGAVSMRFANNRYYSLCEAMRPNSSRMYVPTSSSEWNQKVMTKAWHIDELYAQQVSDRVLIRQVVKDIDALPEPYFVGLVTLASHSPFTAYADSLPMNIPSHFPRDLRNYLQSLHYTDACLGELVDKIHEQNESTILAIMGDHTIFYPAQRKSFSQVLGQIPEAFVPFIVYAPYATGCIATDTIGQVDTYSILLPYVQQGLYWQGVGGKGLSDEEQKRISSWIIHSDAFRE